MAGPFYTLVECRSAVRLRLGNVTGALADAEDALKLAPNYAQGYICIGDAFMEMDQLNEAETAYSMALEKDPSIRRSKSFKLFNSLLLRRECCSFSNGEYVKSGLAELEKWCGDATEEHAGSSSDEFKHIRQAVGLLVIHQKPKKSLREITNDLCPALSIQQLYRISTMYWDDKYGTHTVSAEVIQSMRVLMTEELGNAFSTSFLLDDW